MFFEKLYCLLRFLAFLIIALLFVSCSKYDFEFLDNIEDMDGNVYKTVRIGNQTWMAENLKTTKYSDGTQIPLANSNSDRMQLSKAYFYYNDDPAYSDLYGALYTWSAAMNGEGSSNLNPSGIQGVCPVGWHIPSEAEWIELEDYLGGSSVAGGKLKETGTLHWDSPNTGATNEYGFSALPSGILYSPTSLNSGGVFAGLGSLGGWRTSSYAKRYVIHSSIELLSSIPAKGFSIRCVKNSDDGALPVLETNDIKYVSDVSAIITAKIISSGGSNIFNYGMCWDTDSTSLILSNATHNSDDPMVNGSFVNAMTNLTPDTKYFYRAFATNETGTGYGNIISFRTKEQAIKNINFPSAVEYSEITDQDGNSYRTVQIGSQTWMAENLKAITYNDNKTITYFLSYDSVAASNKQDYGLLYSRINIRTDLNICPVGWHLPSVNDWDTLVNYLGEYENAGFKLKESGFIHWNEQDIEADNQSGFTALPGGYYNTGTYSNISESGYFLTSFKKTERAVGTLQTYNYIIVINGDSNEVLKLLSGPDNYSSIRCIKDAGK